MRLKFSVYISQLIFIRLEKNPPENIACTTKALLISVPVFP